MKSHLLEFIDTLRNAGLSITAAETMDAVRAVSITGIERAQLREGLAAALVKDEADRPAFIDLFDRYFAVPGRQRGKGERPQPTGESEGHGTGKSGLLPRSEPRPERQRPEEPGPEPRQRESPHQRLAEQPRKDGKHEHKKEERGDQLARKRALLQIAFREMSAPEIEECDLLVTELARRFRAHLCRRQRATPHGRLDIRRTIRRSMSTGGIPLEPAFRERQPGRPDLVALCDHSHSVATASRFLLALLAPAHSFFRRVRLFAFVDRPVEISFEAGTLIPHDRLDLYARSDFGKALVAFWDQYQPLLNRNTILLILGDARNNRRPPRADVLARMHTAVRQLVWLNPEPPARWNTGDSVMAAYQRHCDALLTASTLQHLYAALRQPFRAHRGTV